MGRTITGRIEPIQPSSISLAGCRVDVILDQKGIVSRLSTNLRALSVIPGSGTNSILDTEPSVRQARLAARTDAKGVFVVQVADGVDITGDLIRVMVASPAGQQIGVATFAANDIPELLKVPVDTSSLETIVLTEPVNVTPPRTRRLTGRVFDRGGRTIPTGLQVLISARKPPVNGVASADLPVLVLRTETAGYFAGEAPSDHFESATALVAGVATEFPVTLENGFLPKNLPIVIDLPESDESSPSSDCECGTAITPRTPTHEDIENTPDAYSTDLGSGRCVQFTVPNRSIDEFDFYSVVRTTEPDIVAFNSGNERPAGVTQTEVVLASLQAAADSALAARSDAQAAAAAAIQSLNQIQAAAAAAQELRTAYDAIARTAYGLVWYDVNAALQRRRDGNWNMETERTTLSYELHSKAQLSATVSTEIADKLLNLVQSYTPEALKQQTGDLAHVLITIASTNGIAAANLLLASQSEAATRSSGATAKLDELTRAAAAASAALDAYRVQVGAHAQSQLQRANKKPVGRAVLNALNAVDWDDTPTFYQAAEIAHGHLLHFKQVWYADGYSLGDLLYSLPLAPGQKKMVSVVDWERRERADRAEDTVSTEGLTASISRDRDLGEVVTGALSESSRGGSKSTTAGIGAGTGGAANGTYEGINFGALVGVSGGYGEANSSAWQDSAKNIASNSLQTLRDRTLQSASAVRGLRSSVVSTVSQGEAVRATTEVVANHNHCHALTIQYFEVLRHLKLQHELVDVQECLFIPLPMSEFDLEKALRWRQELGTYLQRPKLAGAFDAARRVLTNWSQVVAPVERYSDEFIQSIAGEFLITVLVPMPPMPELPKPRPEDTAAETAQAISDAVNPTTGFLGVVLAIATGGASLIAGAATSATINASKAAAMGARAVADGLFAELDPVARYKKYHQEIVPGVVEGFIDQLELYARIGSSLVPLDSADFTLASEYQPGVPLSVSLRAGLSGQYKRSDISQLVIKSASGLPRSFRAIVNSANLRYRTSSFEHSFVSDSRVNDDIDPPTASAVVTSTGDIEIHTDKISKGAMLFTPIDEWEQRRPRVEDQRLAAELVEHLNNNFEYYHHAIWWAMDPNRRFMLLDGFYAPGSNNRSVASVVENRLIGIVGNSVVLPVARGVHLDPRFAPDKDGNRVDLVEFYRLDTPVPPVRVSLPTRGVFAEAVMGTCNSCEKMDESRFWRWEQSPIDDPSGIDAISMTTRRADPVSTQPSVFPAPIISIQNAPAIPDPTGVRAALDALGKQTFADITGLAGTQANAAAAYQQALDTALKFGQEASSLAKQAAMLNSKDKVMPAIDDAESSGKISSEDAKTHRNNALGAMTFSPPPLVEAVPSTPDEWNPWPGGDTGTTPVPPVPVPTPVPGTKRSKMLPVSIKLRVFVPSQVWEPFPLSLTWAALPAQFMNAYRFNGDHRTFSYNSGTSRVEAQYNMMINADTLEVVSTLDKPPVYGWAEVYKQLDTTDEPGKPEWWEVLDPGKESLLPRRKMVHDPTQLLIDPTGNDESVEVAFTLKAKPYFPWTADELPNLVAKLGNFGVAVEDLINAFKGSVIPDIDAQIILTITKNSSGALQYVVTGSHDMFPAYEVYVNGEQAYRWGDETQLSANDAPLGLMPAHSLQIPSTPPKTVKPPKK